ncbi:hypothetical protein PFISCL1PPCAC_3574, partial [Pristionchus fissidentatus]
LSAQHLLMDVLEAVRDNVHDDVLEGVRLAFVDHIDEVRLVNIFRRAIDVGEHIHLNLETVVHLPLLRVHELDLHRKLLFRLLGDVHLVNVAESAAAQMDSDHVVGPLAGDHLAVPQPLPFLLQGDV